MFGMLRISEIYVCNSFLFIWGADFSFCVGSISMSLKHILISLINCSGQRNWKRGKIQNIFCESSKIAVRAPIQNMIEHAIEKSQDGNRSHQMNNLWSDHQLLLIPAMFYSYRLQVPPLFTPFWISWIETLFHTPYFFLSLCRHSFL